jgi:hypothetical protein
MKQYLCNIEPQSKQIVCIMTTHYISARLPAARAFVHCLGATTNSTVNATKPRYDSDQRTSKNDPTTAMQRPGMSRNPNPTSLAMQSFAEMAEAEGDEARQETINSFDRMAAYCKEWLTANGEPLVNESVSGMSDIDFVDHTRRVQVPTNVPANIEDLGSLNEVYVAEGNLLNKTQRALMEYHLRFSQNPDGHESTPVAEVMKTMQAFAAKVRGFVLTNFDSLAYMLTVAAGRPMS